MFLPQENMVKDFSQVRGDDVVVLPAFGATLQEMEYLVDLGCQIVDTTCPWVSKVRGSFSSVSADIGMETVFSEQR